MTIMNMKRTVLLALGLTLAASALNAKDFEGIVSTEISSDRFTLIQNGNPVSIVYDENDFEGVKIAVRNLRQDFGRVCGKLPSYGGGGGMGGRGGAGQVIVGSIDSKVIGPGQCRNT